MKRIALCFLMVPLLFVAGLSVAGCNTQTASQKAEQIIQALLNVAQAEEAGLSPADAAILTPWVALGNSLEGQLTTCTTAAGTSKAKALACFNTFAGGLLSTQELAQLRILSPAAQSKVQLYVTAIVVGVNVAVTSLSSTPVATPTVGTAAPATSAQLDQLRTQLDAKLFHDEMYTAVGQQ